MRRTTCDTQDFWLTIVSFVAAFGLTAGGLIGCKGQPNAEKPATGAHGAAAPATATAAQASTPASPGRDGLPPISGMARLDATRYLLVHDGRIPAHDRFGLLTLGRTLTYRSLGLEAVDPPGEPLSDLEAIAAIPGAPGRYLLLESGNGKPPRRLLVEIAVADDGAVTRVGSVDLGPQTAALTNCESLLCWEFLGELRLVLADRGGMVGETLRADYIAGTLTRGEDGTLSFAPKTGGSLLVRGPTGEHWRACSDLYLEPTGVIWGACAKDPPGATGPFDSWLYVAGAIGPDGYPAVRSATPSVQFGGLKVEAIAANGATGMAVASDDETLGGVWRPLAPQKP